MQSIATFALATAVGNLHPVPSGLQAAEAQPVKVFSSPQEYEVRVSDDGERWGSPLAVGRGELGITTINFPLCRARWIRITQTSSNSRYNWSVYELDVYRGTR